ncbi:MAG: 50S ribosomal protein L21 [Acidimicrobiia bacterium]
MYAIIRTGGKQAKVREGDVIDVERLRSDGEVTFTPLLIVADDGKVTSGRDALQKATVTARILGPSQGPKIDALKYKAKTGYRRRYGHRQKYTRIEVTKIDSGRPKRSKKPAAEVDSTEES